MHSYGKVGAQPLAEPTSGAGLWIGQFNDLLGIQDETPFGAHFDADIAALAPGLDDFEAHVVELSYGTLNH